MSVRLSASACLLSKSAYMGCKFTALSFQLLLENEKTMQAPEVQRMSDDITVTRDRDEEQQEALRRAITLGVADIKMPSAYGTFDENPTEAAEAPLLPDSGRRRAVWEEWIARIFEKDESGQIVPRT